MFGLYWFFNGIHGVNLLFLHWFPLVSIGSSIGFTGIRDEQCLDSIGFSMGFMGLITLLLHWFPLVSIGSSIGFTGIRDEQCLDYIGFSIGFMGLIKCFYIGFHWFPLVLL